MHDELNVTTNIDSNCYLCGCTEQYLRQGRVRDKFELKILECASCGLVFLSSFDHIKSDFYETAEMHGTTIVDGSTWIKDSDVDDERRYQNLKSILPNKKVLDFGCGAGGFLLKAQALASEVCGVELDRSLKGHFESNGLHVVDDIVDIPMEDGNGYDIITMFHVLEHLEDPMVLLKKISNLLTEDGQIIIEVPNADDALLTLYKNDAFSNFTYWSCHLFLYNSRTLQMLFDKIGFQVNYIKQVQRYPLSNCLHWLSNALPGGHKNWCFLDSTELHVAYEKQLAAIGKCDTVLASISRR